jgi:hypothetical protein
VTALCFKGKKEEGKGKIIHSSHFKLKIPIVSVALRPKKASVEANFFRAVFVF